MHINNQISKENILNLKFEELLIDSEHTLEKLFYFCDFSKFNISNSLKIIDKNVTNKYDTDESLYNNNLLS
jgi:hypothetical protein